MNAISKLNALVIVTFVTFILAGCAGTDTNTASASVRKEELLTQAGFKVQTVTTDTQKQQLAALEPNKVSAVKYNGKLYYTYPDVAHNQVYVGRQSEYIAYKKLLGERIAEVGPNSGIIEETAGPHHIVIERFNGWGPLGE